MNKTVERLNECLFEIKFNDGTRYFTIALTMKDAIEKTVYFEETRNKSASGFRRMIETKYVEAEELLR